MPSNPPAVESSAFRSVKTQDLVKLRKFLEKGDLHEARKLIWSNPRYLVSSGDTPTILQVMIQYYYENLKSPDYNQASCILSLRIVPVC